MLSRYTWMNRLMQSRKIAVISHWKVEGVLQSPICITWLLNVPRTVANTVLWMCSGIMHMLWSYQALIDMPPGHIIVNDILVMEWSHILDRVIVLFS